LVVGLTGDGYRINGAGILNGSFNFLGRSRCPLNGVDFAARTGDKDGIGLRIYGE